MWLLAALAALGFALCCNSDSAKAKNESGPPAIKVKLQVEQPAPVRDSSEYIASLRSRDSAEIRPQVDGQVTKIFVHSGESVAAGTPLMQIDPIKQEATVHNQEASRAAQAANVRYAQQQHDRNVQLHSAGVISKQALEESQAALDAAKAQLAALEAAVREQQVQLHYYRVAAPMKGIVGDIPVRVGDRATTSTLLTTVDKPGALEAYIQVPVERAPDLRMGEEVEVLDPSGSVAARGKISFISPEVDNQAQTVLAKAQVDNKEGRLRTAQFVRVRVIWGARPALSVPVLAVQRISGQPFAFVAEDEGNKLVARQRQLQLGEMVGNDYVVLGGLKAGDRVIVSGTQMLADGTPVMPE
jgi:RND family efflux transporter MFP subunit